jgi:hypothetical protein
MKSDNRVFKAVGGLLLMLGLTFAVSFLITWIIGGNSSLPFPEHIGWFGVAIIVGIIITASTVPAAVVIIACFLKKTFDIKRIEEFLLIRGPIYGVIFTLPMVLRLKWFTIGDFFLAPVTGIITSLIIVTRFPQIIGLKKNLSKKPQGLEGEKKEEE